MSKIPNFPGLPSIPKVPLLNFLFKDFKDKKPQKLPTYNSKKSIFSENLNIVLDEAELEEFFKIPENIPRKESLESSETTKSHIVEKPFSISSLIDKNRFTAIYITTRRLNNLVRFNYFLEGLHEILGGNYEEKSSLEIDYGEITNFLLMGEALSCMYTIFPTENEIKIISGELSKLKSDMILGDSENWLIKCCEFPQLKNLILSLMSLVNLKIEVQEISHIINNYSLMYSRIINNHNFKLFSNIILKINNFLNRETGKKELINFEIISFESLLNLKVNSKNFVNFAFSKYFAQLMRNYDSKHFKLASLNIFDRQEINILESLLENNNSLSNLFSQIEKIKKDFEESKETLLTIIKNKTILSIIKDFSAEIEDKQKVLDLSLLDEFQRRKEFFEFFDYASSSNSNEEENKDSLTRIISIFKNILLISKKSIACLKEYTIPKQSHSEENPEKVEKIQNKEKKEIKENKNIEKVSDSVKSSKPINDSRKLSALGHPPSHSSFLSLKYKLK